MNLLNFLLEEYEHEARHRIAQQNAALPIEQGGLGLHKDNTSMDRAKALGFDVDTHVYHGTGADIKAFDPLKRGKNSDAGWYGDADYTTPNTTTADVYSRGHDMQYRDGSNIMPLLAKMKNPYDYRAKTNNARGLIQNNQGASLEFRKKLQDDGYDSVAVKNSFIHLKDNEYLSDNQWTALSNASPLVKKLGKEKIENTLRQNGGISEVNFTEKYGKAVSDIMPKRVEPIEYATFHPNQLRSRFAAFDPMKKHSDDILA